LRSVIANGTKWNEAIAKSPNLGDCFPSVAMTTHIYDQQCTS